MKHPMIRYGIGVLLLLVGLGAALLVASGHAAPARCAAIADCQSADAVKQMIRVTFGANASQALRVAACESGYNPNAYNPASGTMGIFQFAPGTWSHTPFVHDNPFDAQANIYAAYYVFVRDGHSWREWSCR